MTGATSSTFRTIIAALALLAAWALVLANTLVAFEPELVSADLRGFLDPSVEFGPANAMSASLFALLAAVSGWNALTIVRNLGPRNRRVLGWAGIAVLAMGLAIDELTDAHLRLLSDAYLAQVGRELGFIRGYAVWVGLAAPLALVVAVLFIRFIHRELAEAPLLRRAAWIAGFLWVTVLAHEALAGRVFATRAPALENLLEEGAEILGTATLIAVAALAFNQAPRTAGVSRRRIGLALAVVALSAGAWLGWRAEVPLNDWGTTDVWMGPFPAGTAAAQTLALPGGPLGRVDVEASYAASDDIPGVLAIRLQRPDGASVREASAAVVPGTIMTEHVARFTPIVTTAGERAVLQVSALPSVSGAFTLSVTSDDLQVDGAVFPNGQDAPPGQDLNYRLYGPRNPSFAKLAAVVRLVLRDPVMLAILADAALLGTVAAATTMNLLAACLSFRRRRRRFATTLRRPL